MSAIGGKNKKGFSLLEIMITVAIVGILTAVVLTMQSRSRKARELEMAGRKVSAKMREIQNNSLSGKQMAEGVTACGFGYTPAASGNKSYRAYYNYYDSDRTDIDCSSVAKGFGGSSAVYEEVRLEDNSTASGRVYIDSGTLTGAYFSIPHGSVFNNSGAVIVSTRYLTLRSDAGYYNVCFYPTGKIEEPGLNTSCP